MKKNKSIRANKRNNRNNSNNNRSKQPANPQPGAQPAQKLVVTGDQSRDDLYLLSMASDLINHWQQKDPDNRFAFCLTVQQEGYSFERFFQGDTMDNQMHYAMLMSAPFFAEPTLLAHLNFIKQYVDDNIEYLHKAYREGKNPEEVHTKRPDYPGIRLAKAPAEPESKPEPEEPEFLEHFDPDC